MRPGEYTRAVVDRLKTVRGPGGRDPDGRGGRLRTEVMKQPSALQSSLGRSHRFVLPNHLKTCVPGAVQGGRGVEALAELGDALKLQDGLRGPVSAAALTAESAPVPAVSALERGDDSR